MFAMPRVSWARLCDTVGSRVVDKRESNSLTPFVLKGDPSRVYSLNINCNEAAIRSFNFDSPYEDLCSSKAYKGNIDTLNSMLGGLSFSLKKELNQNSSFVIEYDLIDGEDDELSIVYSYTQELIYFQTIPFTIVDAYLHTDSKERESFSMRVAEVDGVYDSAFGDHTYNVVFDANTDSAWISYKFEGRSLFFSGEIPASWKAGSSVGFYIEDQINKLVSESFTVRSSVTANSASSKALNIIIVFSVSFTLICAVLILIIYKSTRPKKPFPKLKLDIENSDKNPGLQPNVLSDSILAWNSSICDRYVRKQPGNCSTPKGKKMLEFASDSEDDSFSTEDDLEDPSFSVESKISRISAYSPKHSFQSQQTKLTFFDHNH